MIVVKDTKYWFIWYLW